LNKKKLFKLFLFIFLFNFPSDVFASDITLSVNFPDKITIGEDVNVVVTLSGTDESYNLKVYASPTSNSRHSSYVETKNQDQYITSGWENYPLVSNGDNDIVFRLKKFDESGKMFLRVGINTSTNVYTDWVEVDINESEQEVIENVVVEQDQVVEEKPVLKVSFEDKVFFNEDNEVEIEIENSNKEYFIKVLGSTNKKNYGYIKTINDDNLFSWNSSWDDLPTIKGNKKDTVKFFVDADLDQIYLKVRAKEVDSSNYIDSEYVEVDIKVSEKLGTAEAKEKEPTKKSELVVPQKYYLDSNNYSYKKIGLNLIEEKQPVKPKVIYEELVFKKEDSRKDLNMVGFSIWNLLQNLLIKLKR